MSLLNYTTSISVEKTLGEIQRSLAKAGASKIMTDYDDTGNIVSLSFQLKLNDNPIAFTLPTDWKPVLEVLKRDPKVPVRLKEEQQARRVAWRITKDWVQAQLAIIETRMVTTAQVFLPYAVTSTGQLMYEYVSENSNSLLLGGGIR